MHLQDWGVVGTQPAKPSASETPGYPTNGSPPGTAPTVLDARYLSVLIRELYAAVDLFDTPDRTDDEQLAGILAERISAIRCGASDSGSVTTEHLRAVLASTTSQATGAESAVIASDDMLASGADSAAIASDGNGSPQAVAALRSLVAACLSCGTAGSGGREAVILGSELSSTSAAARAALVASSIYALITGTRGAVIATEGTSGVSAGVTGTNSAVLASLRTDGTVDAGAAQGVVVASEDSYITGGTEGAVVASEDSYITTGAHCAVVASDGSSITGGSPQQTVILASESCRANATGNVLLVGSVNAEVATRTNGIALGYSASTLTPSGSDQNLTMWLDSEDGEGYGSAWNTGGADYAEYFECLESIPAGSPVGLVEVEGAMYACVAADGEEPIGIVSPAPGVLGNDDSMGWAGKFERDEYGGYVLSESGHRVTSEDYDRSQIHVPRSRRPDEWVCVGMMGQIHARVGESVTVGQWLTPKGGVLVGTKKPTRLRALRLTSSGVALVLVR